MTTISTVKVEVFISHRSIGYLKKLETRGGDHELVVVSRLINASKFSSDIAGIEMAKFEGPERPSSKAPIPSVTFRLIKH